jgi:hypothetical protein
MYIVDFRAIQCLFVVERRILSLSLSLSLSSPRADKKQKPNVLEAAWKSLVLSLSPSLPLSLFLLNIHVQMRHSTWRKKKGRAATASAIPKAASKASTAAMF